jgi:hypothetical protein
MLHPPHDFQIVASVTIKDKFGKILTPDLSKQGFTLKPASNFSLNDFLNGTLTKFDGEIYQGGFEQDGKILSGFESVQIEILKIELARQLPDQAKQNSFEVIDLAKNHYVTNIITPTKNTQSIENKTLEKNLWCVIGPDFFEPCP